MMIGLFSLKKEAFQSGRLCRDLTERSNSRVPAKAQQNQ